MRRTHGLVWLCLLVACDGSSPRDDAGGDSPGTLDAGGDAAIDASFDAAVDATIACSGQQTACDGACVTLSTDRMNCGRCGFACAMSEVCSDGACALDCAPPSVRCEVGGTPSCADLSNDESHCGSCGRQCDPGLTCLGGDCALGCAGGTVDCNGSCVDLTSDAEHCGTCENACDRDHAVGACVASACAITCDVGFDDCDLSLDNGCEIDIETSVDHCHACGAACDLPHVGDHLCAVAGCAIVSCDAGFDDCDGLAANGCEADLSSAVSCGACGVTCDALHPCFGGACLAAPVAGSASLPSCGSGDTYLEGFTVDPTTNDAIALVNADSGVHGCTFRGPGARGFVRVPGGEAPIELAFGHTPGELSAAGSMLVMAGALASQISRDGGSSWQWIDRPAVGAASPTAIVLLPRTISATARSGLRIDAAGVETPIALPSSATAGGVAAWDVETGRFNWMVYDAGTDVLDVYRSTDDGRSFALVGSLSVNLASGTASVSAGYLHGVEVGTAGAPHVWFRIPESDLSLPREDVVSALGCPAPPCAVVATPPVSSPMLGAIARATVGGSSAGYLLADASGLAFVPRTSGASRFLGFRERRAVVEIVPGAGTSAATWRYTVRTF